MYKKSITEVYGIFGTSPTGLSSAEAAVRLEKDGANVLAESKRRPFILKLLGQFRDIMVLVLIGAAVLSAVIGFIEQSVDELIDSLIIFVIVAVNAIIGLVQENRAEAALDALKKLNAPKARVLRDGAVCKIPSEQIVTGDVILLEAGDIVPADMRLFEAFGLKIQEAALTGESVPGEKNTAPLTHDAPMGDRHNTAFASGVVTYGRGRGIAVATGMQTEVGKIAAMLETREEPTPLQKKLDSTGKVISAGVCAIAAAIFVINILTSRTVTHGNRYLSAFMTAIAIAVAAIPEGLPAVVTIVMALGVTRLSKRNAIIRRLPAVETLGCTQVICSDKTGTLTLNKMTVKSVFCAGSRDEILRCMTLCNDASSGVGDPTELALIEYAAQNGLQKTVADARFPRVDERPFDSARKLMTTVHSASGSRVLYTKGAPDELLKICTQIADGNGVRAMTASDRTRILNENSAMAREAMRVLGFAVARSYPIEAGMTFLGLVGMIDPPREEAKEAILTCRRAGMLAVMITGDHRDTAFAVARELGIAHSADEVLTGAELDAMSDKEFRKSIEKYRVYARVSPQNKARIVSCWRAIGKVVAMTGDGVNDAIGLKQADIGVGMGIIGTDVTKNVADMVLADDNFATIVVAVEEGRKIYNNIEKSIQFLFSANIAEVLSLFFVTVFFPWLRFMAPVQILWVNLVTDTFPALALGVERAEPDIMSRPPRRSGGNLFAGRLGKNILWQGAAQFAIVTAVFIYGCYAFDNAVGTTMALVALCVVQLFHAFNMRSDRAGIFQMGLFSNPQLWVAFFGGFMLTIAVVGLPFLNNAFQTVPLDMFQWAVAILSAALIIPLVEAVKYFSRPPRTLMPQIS